MRYVVTAAGFALALTAFPALATTFANTPLNVWGDWLTTHYLHNMAGYLPKRFVEADFAFYGKVIGGQQALLPRETLAVRLVDRRLGHPLGKIYVSKYFPPESKAKVEALIANLLKAYDADIRTLPWMSEATRQKALEKLHKFTPHIGYPDKWIDYSAYTVMPGALVTDAQNGAEFEWHRELNRIDQPVDKAEWGMTPSTVNAYYNPSVNDIVFPAAILQAPFFDPNADAAVNYGGIGAVIGHEISHGFDDQGRQFDGDGNLRDWWTPADAANFGK